MGGQRSGMGGGVRGGRRWVAARGRRAAQDESGARRADAAERRWRREASGCGRWTNHDSVGSAAAYTPPGAPCPLPAPPCPAGEEADQSELSQRPSARRCNAHGGEHAARARASSASPTLQEKVFSWLLFFCEGVILRMNGNALGV